MFSVDYLNRTKPITELNFCVYLAAYKNKCRYVTNGVQCVGKPVLKCLWFHDETTSPSYFIGCSEWKLNERYHWFISIKDNVDFNLLSQLLNGLLFIAAHPHHAGNIIKQRIHSHPPPPPSHVPVTIWDCLQKLIHQANDDTVDVTPTRIITGNLILVLLKQIYYIKS
ncbi:hypothetical protein RhiirA1_479404 [Rhizophagus irregularis]|uniref:Uncharacterized protein n=1 Tax=Rhizophagus irregularis TaxID=588596 RepID=A0A2I1FDA1_9GLOM|nr:hypothetical protein RhiirA1_479404 [Rhizophagus irregularis]PKY32354.1 hypothetical protein RhiirB3_450482 [Rhizophagus irregularis]